MMPTKEQWFWEQCGFKHNIPFPELAKRKDIPHPERFEKEQWYIPGIYCGSEPFIDLNNLFKYAVPKLQDYTVGKHFMGGHYAVAIPNDNPEFGEAVDKDPALALFRAIYKALGGKE